MVLEAGKDDAVAQVAVLVAGTRLGVVTDDSGSFQLRAVSTDTARVVFRHPCFFPVEVTVLPGDDADIVVGLPVNERTRANAGCGGLGARKRSDH